MLLDVIKLNIKLLNYNCNRIEIFQSLFKIKFYHIKSN